MKYIGSGKGRITRIALTLLLSLAVVITYSVPFGMEAFAEPGTSEVTAEAAPTEGKGDGAGATAASDEVSGIAEGEKVPGEAADAEVAYGEEGNNASAAKMQTKEVKEAAAGIKSDPAPSVEGKFKVTINDFSSSEDPVKLMDSEGKVVNRDEYGHIQDFAYFAPGEAVTVEATPPGMARHYKALGKITVTTDPGEGEGEPEVIETVDGDKVRENKGSFSMGNRNVRISVEFKDSATYIDENNVKHEINDFKIIDRNFPDEIGVTLDEGWYVVADDKTFNNRLTIAEETNLILGDGVTLTCDHGIRMAANNYSPDLRIWSESYNNDAGRLIAKGEKYDAGIGGNEDENNGVISIHGGMITATGGEYGAGIGGGDNGSGIKVSIYGGKVVATGGRCAAGIGGGEYGTGAKVFIYGGEVTAKGGVYAAGIGGGEDRPGNPVLIDQTAKQDTKVTATGGENGAGIGGGEGGSQGGSVTINKGVVTAWGGANAAGIGGGEYNYGGGNGGAVTIGDGAVVTAHAGSKEGENQAIGHGGANNGLQTGTISIGEAERVRFNTVNNDPDEGTQHLCDQVVKDEDGVYTSIDLKVKERYSHTYFTKIEPCGDDHYYVFCQTVGSDDKHAEACLYCGGIKEGSEKPHEYNSNGECIDCHLKKGGVSYIDEHGELRTLAAGEYTDMSEAIFDDELDDGWYVVRSNERKPTRVTVIGDVKIILADGSNLTYNSGIRLAQKGFPAKLTIYGQSKQTGTLTADASNQSNKAGIGGDDGENNGLVNIYGGKIEAKGGSSAAGIGGGRYGRGGTVNIIAGEVEARGGDYAAGIGSGDTVSDGKSLGAAQVGKINIKGGKVTAIAGDQAAGIGGGNEVNGALVKISGGTVIAKCEDDYGAGIGSGDDSMNGGEVHISGGTVTVNGGVKAAGIGSGFGNNTSATGGMIDISGGTVTATGGSYGAGIGGGYDGTSGTITIKDAKVTATAGTDAAGIGSSDGRNSGSVSISGNADVTATGGNYGAGIGGGDDGDGGNVVIKDNAKVVANGGTDGAGIGGGEDGAGATVTISDKANVTANGKSYGAGIGGGESASAKSVTIDGKDVTVRANAGADGNSAAIGRGDGGEAEAGSISLYDYLKVSSERLATTGERVPFCYYRKSVVISPCDHPSVVFEQNKTTHKGKCSYCSLDGEQPHEFEMQHNDEEHWQVCTVCKYEKDRAEHSPASISTSDKCGTCDVELASVTLRESADIGKTEKHYVVKSSWYQLPAKPDDFSVEGSSFTGWRIEGGEKLYYPGDIVRMDADKVIIAQWNNSGWGDLKTSIENAGVEPITLTGDYKAGLDDEALVVPEGKTVTLNLNRHTIDRGLNAAKENGCVLIVKGNLTIKGEGTITGGYNSGDGGGILVDGGTLIIEDADVTGNRATKGAGIFVSKGSSSLTIGKNDGGFSSANVTGNTNYDGNASNVYLSEGKTVGMGSSFKLMPDSVIGISISTETAPAAGNPVVVTGVFGAADKTDRKGSIASIVSDDKSYLTAINSEYKVMLSADKATLSFDPGEGQGEMPQMPVAKNSLAILPLSSFTHEYKTFDKWQVGETEVTAIDEYAPIGDSDEVTAVALWTGEAPQPETYRITTKVDPSGAAFVTADKSMAVKDDAVNIMAVPKAGYEFTNWSLSGPGAIASKSTTPTVLTMGDGDVEVTAHIAPIKVRTVTLNKESLDITSGGSNNELKATVSPEDALNKKVTWSSSEESVAAVSVDENGTVTVTGKNNGTASIIATTEDGGHTASCKVTVTGHVHVMTHYSGSVPATCTSRGIKRECYVCNNCGVAFEDEDGKNPIDDASAFEPALGHKWDVKYVLAEDKATVTASAACSREGCSETLAAETADVTVNRQAPGCTTTGSELYTANFETPTYAYTEEVELPATGHKWVEAGRVNAEGTQAGYINYKCANCGETYTVSIAAPEVYDAKLPKVTIKKPAKAKKAIKVKWKKLSRKKRDKISRIEIEYARDKKFTKSVKFKTAKKTKTSLKIKKLKSKKTYYVRVRTFKYVGNIKHVSGWSKIKKVKTR